MIPGGPAILVVEDDTDFAEAVRIILTEDSYAPVVVHTAKEALIKLRNQKFSALLLDIKLGAETSKEIINLVRQKNSIHQKTPIVAMSGFFDRSIVEEIAPQIQGALVKPFEPSLLLNTIKKHMI